jgi:hypothetical protein
VTSTEATEEVVTDPWITNTEARLDRSLTEAQELRYSDGLPALEEGISGVLARLADIRLRLDRVEVLVSEVARFRAQVRVALKASTAQVDDTWAEKVAGSGGRGNRASFGGFEDAPREKYARADVAVLGLRIVARRRERVFDAIGDTYDGIDRVRRGLDSVRFDLHAMLRVLSVPEHRLDRTDG